MNQRVGALIEVTVFLAGFIIIAFIIDLLVCPSIASWLKKGYMIALSVGVILVRRKQREYGLIPHDLWLDIRWVLIILAIFLIPALFMVVIYVGIPSDGGLLLEFIWYIIFVGIAEEIMFRGYIQSRLNEHFTKTCRRFMGYDVEWHQGTLIAGALIFGPIHLINAVNIREGYVDITTSIIIIAIVASFFGILFGVVREITGDIWICSFLHGIIDFVAVSLSRYIPEPSVYWIPLAVGFFIMFGFLFEVLIGDYKSK